VSTRSREDEAGRITQRHRLQLVAASHGFEQVTEIKLSVSPKVATPLSVVLGRLVVNLGG
ncbi:MAG: hypothetical protein RJA70_1540, partial [Pseudomonadota bacterium]